MRLIDADAIDYDEYWYRNGEGFTIDVCQKAQRIIDEQPTIEPNDDLTEYEETDGVITIEKQSAKDVGDIKHIVIHSPNYTRYFYNESMPLPAEAVQGWIPFTRRPMTEEEQEYYPNCTFIFDCVLPDDGDEILVSNGRFVWMDTFCKDIDGCYLDGGDDIDEDMAWMPLPKPMQRR